MKRVTAACCACAFGVANVALAQPAETPPSASFDVVDEQPAEGEKPKPQDPAPAQPAPTQPAPAQPAPTQPDAAQPAQPAPAAPAPGPAPPPAAPGAYPYAPVAYDPPPPLAPEPPPKRSLSVSLSPLHLLFPIVEVMVELRPVDHLGLALIGGYGQLALQEDTAAEETRLTAYELGVQLAGYPFAPFDNVHFGGELMYLKVDAEEISGTTFTGVASGAAAGPFAGYKLITRGGFTFIVQGGIQFVIVHAEVEDASSGASAQSDDRSYIPLLNVNLGWSF